MPNKLTFLVVALATGISSTSQNSNNFSLLHLSNFSFTLIFCFSCKNDNHYQTFQKALHQTLLFVQFCCSKLEKS
uniref:Uncharacterized protein MANES_15G060500 n=1 Tax=Rhizophora mucronata TaxID=61149 RepID=A0A2P2LVR4_RHIMU